MAVRVILNGYTVTVESVHYRARGDERRDGIAATPYGYL